jgi:hypothetical protein
LIVKPGALRLGVVAALVGVAAQVATAVPSRADEAPPVPSSGVYEIVDSGERVDIEFRPDGTLEIVTLTLQGCPWPGMVVAEGSGTGHIST